MYFLYLNTRISIHDTRYTMISCIVYKALNCTTVRVHFNYKCTFITAVCSTSFLQVLYICILGVRWYGHEGYVPPSYCLKAIVQFLFLIINASYFKNILFSSTPRVFCTTGRL